MRLGQKGKVCGFAGSANAVASMAAAMQASAWNGLVNVTAAAAAASVGYANVAVNLRDVSSSSSAAVSVTSQDSVSISIIANSAVHAAAAAQRCVNALDALETSGKSPA